MSTEAPKIYTALRANRKEIRILTLFPGADIIECSLQLVSLDEAPKYEALSYVWGDANVQKDIRVDGLPLHVTSNLHAALVHFRPVEGTITLWIDAICINQEDLLERGQQVTLMREIYQKAWRTKVWLGDATFDSGIAMDFIDRCFEFWEACQETSLRLGRSKVDCMLWERPEQLNPSLSLQALERLMKRPWWYRVWVIQELAVSPNAIFHCGPRTCTWGTLQNGIELLSNHIHDRTFWTDRKMGEGERLVDGMYRILDIAATQREIRSPVEDGRSQLLSVLQRHRAGLATDSRDKFIGLAGMTGKGLDDDQYYTRPLTYCFKKAAEYLASNGCSPLNFLDCARESEDDKKNKDLPSWVPDWGIVSRYENGFISQRLFEAESEGANLVSFNAFGLQSPDFEILQDGSCLSATGILIDVVEAVTTTGVLIDCNDLPIDGPFLNVKGTLRNHELPVQLWATLSIERLNETHEPVPSHWLHHFHEVFLGHRFPLSSGRAAETFWLRWYRENINFIIGGRTLGDIVEDHAYNHAEDDPIGDREWYRVRSTVSTNLSGRQLFTTSRGHLGICQRVQPGDIIVILFGCDVPVALRPHADVGQYEFLGTSYVHGIMHGEAIARLERKEIQTQRFDIW